MKLEDRELHHIYALLKQQEERLSLPLLGLLGKIEKELYQQLSIMELEEIAGMAVFRD